MSEVLLTFVAGVLFLGLVVVLGLVIGLVLFAGEPWDVLLGKGILVLIAGVGVLSLVFAVGDVVKMLWTGRCLTRPPKPEWLRRCTIASDPCVSITTVGPAKPPAPSSPPIPPSSAPTPMPMSQQVTSK